MRGSSTEEALPPRERLLRVQETLSLGEGGPGGLGVLAGLFRLGQGLIEVGAGGVQGAGGGVVGLSEVVGAGFGLVARLLELGDLAGLLEVTLAEEDLGLARSVLSLLEARGVRLQRVAVALELEAEAGVLAVRAPELAVQVVEADGELVDLADGLECGWGGWNVAGDGG